LLAALSALLLVPDHAPPIAFVAGVLGPLIAMSLEWMATQLLHRMVLPSDLVGFFHRIFLAMTLSSSCGGKVNRRASSPTEDRTNSSGMSYQFTEHVV